MASGETYVWSIFFPILLHAHVDDVQALALNLINNVTRRHIIIDLLLVGLMEEMQSATIAYVCVRHRRDILVGLEVEEEEEEEGDE